MRFLTDQKSSDQWLTGKSKLTLSIRYFENASPGQWDYCPLASSWISSMSMYLEWIIWLRLRWGQMWTRLWEKRLWNHVDYLYCVILNHFFFTSLGTVCVKCGLTSMSVFYFITADIHFCMARCTAARQLSVHLLHVFLCVCVFLFRIIDKLPTAQSQCQIRDRLPIDMIFTDIVGLIQFKKRVRSGYGKFRYRVKLTQC